MIGSIIDNFKVVSLLGEGGMGTVYKAFDIKLERFVALKVLNAQSLQHPQFVERFKREAKNQAKLNHPNIVPVYGFADEGGVLAIVMEFVEGETLEKMIMRSKRLPLKNALNILAQVLAGVEFAHNKGFIHRDIKPSNIIIGKDGVVKIMDFGISKAVFDKGITKTGTKIGTLLYMSPEQIRAEEPTRQSDIYSIGISFYEMLLGRTPFDKGTEFEIMEAHLKKTPQRLSMALDSIPPEIDKIINKALEKSTQKRYKTCAEFLEDVNAALSKYSGSDEIKPEKKEISEKGKKVKLYFVLFFVLIIFGVTAYFVFDLIKDFWPSLKRNQEINHSDTTFSYKSNPAYIALSNWEKVNTNVGQNLNGITFVDKFIAIACGDSGTIIKTTDGGESWEKIPFALPYNLFDISFPSTQNIFVAGEKGTLFKSTNYGDTWEQIILNYSESLFKIKFRNIHEGYIVGSKGLILFTSNGGVNWEKVESNSSSLLYGIDFPIADIGFVVGWDGTVLRSNDYGKTWFPIKQFTSTYLRDIEFFSKDRGVIVGGGGEIFLTEDGGISWKQIETKTISGLVRIDIIDNNSAIISSNKGEFLLTNDGGRTWTINASGQYASINGIAISQDRNIVAVGVNGLVLRKR